MIKKLFFACVILIVSVLLVGYFGYKGFLGGSSEEAIIEEVMTTGVVDVIESHPSWEFYDVTGTVVYHNPELDWGDGKETMENSLYNVSLRITTDSPFVQQFFFTSGAYSLSQEQEYVEVLLGCTEDMVNLTGTVLIVDRYIDNNGVIGNSGDYVFSSSLSIGLGFSSNLSGKLIQAKITRPANTYRVVGLSPDLLRIGQCIGLSQIKDIQLLDDSKNL